MSSKFELALNAIKQTLDGVTFVKTEHLGFSGPLTKCKIIKDDVEIANMELLITDSLVCVSKQNEQNAWFTPCKK